MIRVESKKYCLYEHSRDGIVFYVGIGISTRPFERVKRNYLWDTHVAGGAFDVTLVEWSDDRRAIMRAEAELIRAKRPCCNQFMNGYTHSPERKAKTSATHRGKTFAPESRAKLAAARQGIQPWNKGRAMSDIQRANLAKRQLGQRIRCIETAQEFDSVHGAVAVLGIARSSLRAHLAGRQSHVRGMTFEVLARGLSGPFAGINAKANTKGI